MSSTIVACATGSDAAALAVIRLSGPDSWPIASQLCGGHSWEHPRRLELVRISDGVSALDRCLAVAFKGPKSFTGEDIIEFHVHGGPGLVEAVIAAAIAFGARRAEPGEFTRRAYLAGKLDLVEAEAIAARAGAATQRAARLAEAGVSTRLSGFAAALEGRLTTLRAAVEGWLDFAPEELADEDLSGLCDGIDNCGNELAAAAALGRRCAPLFAPPVILLAGPVNAGKSSLFNRMVGHERALVSAEPGTTRDWLEVGLQLSAGRILLRDSAGLRHPSGAVEAAGIEQAKQLQTQADLVLWCCDPEQRDPGPPQALAVATKSDLGGGRGLSVSAKTGTGIDELLTQIAQRVFTAEAPDFEAAIPTARRQVELLDHAAQLASEAALRLADQQPELAASDLRGACEALAELTGTQEPDEAMLDALFSRFCLGK